MLCAVVPFVHSGMEQVLPKGAAVPKTGRRIRVLVGEPVAVADLQEAALAESWPDHALYNAIASRIGQELHILKARLEGLPVSEVSCWLSLHQRGIQALGMLALTIAGTDLLGEDLLRRPPVYLWETTAATVFPIADGHSSAGGAGR